MKRVENDKIFFYVSEMMLLKTKTNTPPQLAPVAKFS